MLGLERAVVARIDAGGVYVTIPRLGVRRSAIGPITHVTPGASSWGGLEVGDPVIVGCVGGSLDDLVILQAL